MCGEGLGWERETKLPRKIDYEGSKYRTEFWENHNRRYEDLAERIALKAMLTASQSIKGKRLIEVGAGFGRTADMYEGYEQVILTDYACTQLEEAQRYLGHDDRFTFVVADMYNMPFADHIFDTLVMIRVMHHVDDVPLALKEICRLIHPSGTAIIEHANKRHLKAIIRWLFGLQTWNPYDYKPHEFVELNFVFHPTWLRQQFAAAGLAIETSRTVSHFRLSWLKKIMPPYILAKLDGWVQPTGKWMQFTPSIFLQAKPQK